MADAVHKSNPQASKGSQSKSRSIETAAPSAQENWVGLEMDPAAFAGGDLEAQRTMLSNRNIPVTQRQALAVTIGKVQGNHHLQRVIAMVKRDVAAATAKPVVQRQDARVQRTPAEEEALARAGEDLTYLSHQFVAELRASGIERGDTARINTAAALQDGVLTLGVISQHPNPTTRGGTVYFPDTDLNTELVSTSVDIGGTANVPGSPPNRIFLRTRPHFSRPRTPAARLMRPVVHEAQHFFDRHTDEIRPGNIESDIFDLWLSYKTEFNAYWVDGRFNHYPATPEERQPSGDPMLRWQAIRQYLMETAPYRARYRWLWQDSPPAPPSPDATGEGRQISQWRVRVYPRFHAWFKDQVNNYRQPEAFNRLNSPRIHRFYMALRQRGPVGPILDAWNNLDQADKAEIGASQRFEELIRRRLPDPHRTNILNELSQARSPATVE